MNRIAELRGLKGWTQRQLAERVGVHEMTILRLEKGSTQLTVTWMQKLAKAFGCSAADLLDIATLAETDDDVAAADLGALGPLASAIARRGLSTYKITGTSVTNAGLKPDDLIAVDTAPRGYRGCSHWRYRVGRACHAPTPRVGSASVRGARIAGHEP